MSALIQRHLDSIAASMKLLNAQLDALRFEVAKTEQPAMRVELPLRCAGVSSEDCALRDGEWCSVASFGDPNRVQCGGCEFERSPGGMGD
jgi:hypothetical protein